MICRSFMGPTGHGILMLGDTGACVIVLVPIGKLCTRRVGSLILDVPAEFPAVLLVRMVPVARMCAPIRRVKPLRMPAVVVTNPSRMRLRPFRMMSIEPGWVSPAPPSRIAPDMTSVVGAVRPYWIPSPVWRIEPFGMTSVVGHPPVLMLDSPFRMVSIYPLRMIGMPIFRVMPNAV